jgi:hypothetical protein
VASCRYPLASSDSIWNLKADDGRIIVWSVYEGERFQTINSGQGPVVSLEWLTSGHASGRCIISGGADGTLKLWERRHGDVSLKAGSLAHRVNDVFFQDRFQFSGMFTVLDGAIEGTAVDRAQQMVAVVGLSRLTLFRIQFGDKGVPALNFAVAPRALTDALLDPFKLIAYEPPLTKPGRAALARNVHFIQNIEPSCPAVMVCYLDSKEMYVSSWHAFFRTKIKCL